MNGKIVILQGLWIVYFEKYIAKKRLGHIDKINASKTENCISLKT